MISLQTNVVSLQAQQDLEVNTAFQNNTIQQLSSGYRINSSADDPAGLAVANQYNSDIAEVQQGVRNANDGLSQLQIVDGGLSNISQILNQLKTLATESATSTFTGDRGTLNNEYQSLVSEVTRQADNIQLNSGGTLNTQLNVYVGGGRTSDVAGTSTVNINLGGSSNGVDATSLGLQGTTVVGGGTSFNNTNTVSDLNNANALFLAGSGTETFTVNYANAAGNVATQAVTVTGTAPGLTGSALVSQLNSTLANDGLTGITAQIGSNGDLQFAGGNLLSVSANTASGTGMVTSGATLLNGANFQSTGAFVPFVAGGGGATSQTMNVTVGTNNYGLTLTSATTGTTAADTAADAVASLNAQLKGSGVYATNVNNTVTLQSASAFSVAVTNNTPGSGGASGGSLIGTTPGDQVTSTVNGFVNQAVTAFTPFGAGTAEDLTFSIAGQNFAIDLTHANAANMLDAEGYIDGISDSIFAGSDGGNFEFENNADPFTITVNSYTAGAGSPGTGSLFATTPEAIAVTSPTTSASATGNAQNAITAINSAVTSLGLVQGAVGSGENTLNYAISLAQSQVTNYSAAESQIKDADIAAEAANLTKAQVLQQASIAAMAQANSAPQAILKLLQ